VVIKDADALKALGCPLSDRKVKDNEAVKKQWPALKKVVAFTTGFSYCIVEEVLERKADRTAYDYDVCSRNFRSFPLYFS